MTVIWELFQDVRQSDWEKRQGFICQYIGRVWFHPEYDLELVGYSDGAVTPCHCQWWTSLWINTSKSIRVQQGRIGKIWLGLTIRHVGLHMPLSTSCVDLSSKAAKDNEHNRALIYARNILRILEVEQMLAEQHNFSGWGIVWQVWRLPGQKRTFLLPAIKHNNHCGSSFITSCFSAPSSSASTHAVEKKSRLKFW
jgi:hypothetical protein